MFNNWLKPLNNIVYNNAAENTLAHHLLEQQKTQSPIKQNIALVFYGDQSQSIRKEFHRIDFPFEELSIIDLGNVRNNDPTFVIPFLQELIENNTLPVVISDSFKYSTSIFKAVNNLYTEVNHAIITDNIKQVLNENLEEIFKNEKLKDLSFIAYQKHYGNPHTISIPKCNLNNCISLGEVRDDFSDLEPCLRNVNIASFDLNVIRSADFNAKSFNNPCGLFAEEACRLAKYVGLSEHLKGIHIHGFNFEKEASFTMIANLLFYFTEGISFRQYDTKHRDEFIEYSVFFDNDIKKLTFWKSPRSNIED